jgi:alpha-N-arabinofuranosidase
MDRKNIVAVFGLTVIFYLGATGTKGFAETKPVNDANQLQAEITVSTSEKIGEISPDIYGLFMELCYHEFDHGIWAEMLRSRKFAEDDKEDIKELYGIASPWFAIGRNEKTHFAHDATIYYCGSRSQKIINENGPEHKIGIGQKGLYLDKTKSYQVRVNIRGENIKGPVVIALEGEKDVYAQKEIDIPNKNWNRFSFTLKPTQTDKKGIFTITFKGSGILWVGSVSMMPDDNISGFRKDVIEALRTIHPPNIRWPGGNIVSGYNWEDGIGDRDKRPPKFAREMWRTNDVGTDEFIELCRLTGAKPYIAVNSGDGTAKEAANLVQYCNGSASTKYGKTRTANGHPQPYNVELWGIGNEMFGNWQIGHVDEETYARRHLEFAKAMLAVDKNIKIVAVGTRYWKFPRWNQAIFKTAGKYFDYLSLHSYAKKYRSKVKKKDIIDPNFAEKFYYYIVSSPYGIEEQIIGTDKEIRESLPDRPEVKIAFDEWNAYSYYATYEEADFALRDGIYAAGVLHAFQRQCKAVPIANLSKIVNAIGMIRVNEQGMFLNPQYLVLKMYGNHFGPMLLKTDVKCDSYPAPEYEEGRPQAKGQIPYLDVSATASKDGKSVYAAIINLHAARDIKAKISFDKWDFLTQAKVYGLYADDYLAENTFDNPNKLAVKEGTLNNISNGFDYVFKPHSVTIMEFGKAGQ